jgi:hypothetical protein
VSRVRVASLRPSVLSPVDEWLLVNIWRVLDLKARIYLVKSP